MESYCTLEYVVHTWRHCARLASMNKKKVFVSVAVLVSYFSVICQIMPFKYKVHLRVFL
jgi:hypothetical protein